jgi:hypothetical protein
MQGSAKNRSNSRCQVIDINTLHKVKAIVRLFLVNKVPEINTLTVVLDQFKSRH